MIKYCIGPYDAGTEATHEIEVDWRWDEPHPPVLPAGTFLAFEEDEAKLHPELAGRWLIIDVIYYPDFRGSQSSSISYLVRRG